MKESLIAGSFIRLLWYFSLTFLTDKQKRILNPVIHMITSQGKNMYSKKRRINNIIRLHLICALHLTVNGVSANQCD